jgi:VanZ family protein
MKSKRWKYFIPAFIWAILIFSVSSIPDLSTQSLGFKMMDKLAHFTVFLILGLCVGYGVGSQKISPGGVFWITLGFTTFYGVTDEFHQFFVPGRQMDGFDILADAAGAAAASGLYLFRMKRRMQ